MLKRSHDGQQQCNSSESFLKRAGLSLDAARSNNYLFSLAPPYLGRWPSHPRDLLCDDGKGVYLQCRR